MNQTTSMEQDQVGQKGVDSLIVTDLIELARNRAITDALILSGDEDIKIGVQVAQTFGVRIHLLGIKPARGSQSLSLMMEAGTCHEWDETVIGGWMDCVDDASDSSLEPPAAVRALDSMTAVEAPSTRDEFLAIVDIAVKKRIESLTAPALESHVQHLDAHRNRIHWEIDRPTLGSLRNSLGRNLTETERSDCRQAFAAALRAAQSRSLEENSGKPEEQARETARQELLRQGFRASDRLDVDPVVAVMLATAPGLVRAGRTVSMRSLVRDPGLKAARDLNPTA